MKLSRRRFTRDFKLAVVGEVESGRSAGEVARQYEVSPSQLSRWRTQLQRDPEHAFEPVASNADKRRVAELERKLGQLTLENELLKKALGRLAEARLHSTSKRGKQ